MNDAGVPRVYLGSEIWDRVDYFPFHAIGFKCNPFRALTDDEWPAVAVLPLALQAALSRGVANLQILGPLGHGKTTALLAVADRLRAAGNRAAYEYLPDGQSRFITQAAGPGYFLLDEAQRLSGRERQRLVRLPGIHFVLGSHEDFSPLFAARRLALTTIRIDNDEDHLAALLERRLAYFALDGVPAITFDASAVRFLHRMFGGNVRAAQHFLYEVFQRFPPAGAITAARLQDDPAFRSARPDHQGRARTRGD
jgi:hypothetical protein